MSGAGTKVKDPHSIIKEGAGAIASDSLAAESTRAGGDFAKNRDGEPLGVAGANSTFANTNTSGATRLDPASDAEARMATEDWAEEKKLGVTGSYQKDVGNPNVKESTSNAGVAPSYVSNQYQSGGKPKGKNLTEGGFESNDAKNASFTSEIGSKNDPSRLAEQKMQRENAQSANDAGFPRDNNATGGTPYDALGGDTAA
ncbi:uncharacterized protein EAE97_004357 [Botrytis byssoidea]|uniref:Uncharacterized protein n=2 Tax=Sclerotiniaceae TaxID=28983 RepID=A0A4Z1JD69_9HELO|nr:uncharacterized protein EAE97_004357 [Botrytis byssoidea]KAF7947108.1 hypothetical protein EAE97_004357 [Botrytis byssoidea]TGO67153.1 hypothetical protein BOTNAR_0047g00200 [Botryotinia narcissicola]